MADSDRHDLDEEDRYEDEGRRSIFSALWFRAILVVVVLGVVAAVAVPYLLEWANPQPPQPTSAARPGGMSPPAPPVPAPAPSVAAPPTPSAPTAEKPEPAPRPPAVAQEKPPTVRERPAAPAKKSEGSQTVAAKAPPASRPTRATAGGTYFVQVGAFKDPDAARRLAARLRELKFDVDESSTSSAAAPRSVAAPTTSAPAGSDKYDVYVSGGVPSEINAKLAAKGLSAEQSSAGLVVKPSLPLRDAVALSKDLAVDGLKVQVRRSGGAASTPPVASAPAPSGETFYRVRVGPFEARADAASAMQDLEKRGYKPFLARAGQ